MGTIYLLLTIVTETVAVLCMKESTGFHDMFFSICAVVTYALSFVFLTLALKTLPAGPANAIWTGASTVLVAVLGMLLFKEKLSVQQLISLGLIIMGLIGLNINKLEISSI